MPGFTKLFSTIVDSTIWREDLHVKVVWVTMLAKADKNGMVAMSLPGLADAARVTLEQCKDALSRFMCPDEYSRTKDFEGRRVMETDGGWILLNYLKYRKAQDEDETRIATAERVRRFRERHSVTQTVTQVTDVTPSNAIAEAEAEAEAEDIHKPPRPKRVPKKTASGEYGDYPPEMEEGRTLWRGMLKSLREMQDQFPDHGKYIASAVGTSELTWQAWQKHLGRVVKGTTEKVTNQDILEGVRIWAMEGMRRAQSKTSLSAKMLPSLLNSPDFVDAVIMAVKKRSCSQGVQNAV